MCKVGFRIAGTCQRCEYSIDQRQCLSGYNGDVKENMTKYLFGIFVQKMHLVKSLMPCCMLGYPASVEKQALVL